MMAAGCEAWYPADALAVMGLAEIVRHLPRLLRLRRRAARATGRPRSRPRSSASTRRSSTCAWRARCASAASRPCSTSARRSGPGARGACARSRESVDLVLCVLPFETAFYESHDVRAVFVGHPLADRVPVDSDPAAARAALGLPATGAAGRGPAGQPRRRGAQARSAVCGHPRLARGARARRSPSLRRWRTPRRVRYSSRRCATTRPACRCTLVDGRAQDAMAASDAVLRGVGHGDAGDGTREAADGRCLPGRAAHGVAGAAT